MDPLVVVFFYIVEGAMYGWDCYFQATTGNISTIYQLMSESLHSFLIYIINNKDDLSQ